MTDLIAEFCQVYHPYHSISPLRRIAQEKLLRWLEASLDGRDISTVTSQDLERFLISREVKASTMLKYLKMIRPFAKWMWKNGYITSDQLVHIQGVQAPRGANWSPPRPYTRHEIAHFWHEFDAHFPWTYDGDKFDRTAKRGEYWVQRYQISRDPWEWRKVAPYARRLQAEAIVALALFGGLRRIEIFNLELEDMHYENAYIRVVGAAKNPAGEPVTRAVAWLKPLKLAIENWIEFRAQVIQPEHDRPWLVLYGERQFGPMLLDQMANMLNKIGKGYSLHRLRHTFATERLRNGMKVEILQRAMGHTSIAMTLRYAEIGDEDVIRAAEATNDDFMAAVGREEG